VCHGLSASFTVVETEVHQLTPTLGGE
jgi:hypothetical protein